MSPITRPVAPDHDEQSREESLSVQVYQEMKRKILRAEYKPGASLTEAKLAAEYNVSRMPIRFAVQKLSGEGWLVPDGSRRLRVKDITRKSIEDIYSFREIMETRALQKIFEDDLTWDYSYLVEEKLLQMRRAQNDYYAYLVADCEMHFTLISVFDNDRIKDIYSPLCDELVRIDLLLYDITTQDEHYISGILDGVQKIVEAIRGKDYDTAYFYLKRDHFNHCIGGHSVADLVEQHLRELRAAEKKQKKAKKA